jgi:SMC interacting uncharacterized protein involved in chromosome segregation
MEREYICVIHQGIINMCQQRLRKNKNKLSDEEKEFLKTIVDLTKEAKKAGVSMEKRLLEYYCAIEDLGFERVRKNKNKKRGR